MSDLREQAERMVAERLGFSVERGYMDPHKIIKNDEPTDEADLYHLKLFALAVRLQEELLKREIGEKP